MKKDIDYYFIGIGGISMSALAMILHTEGFSVTGSNIEENAATKVLKSRGITVFNSHDKNNMDNYNIKNVVYTSAIAQNNPELIYAKEKNIVIKTRAQMLGEVSRQYEHVIAVAGSHGKTTTTSMISHIFVTAKLAPTCHIGGVMTNYNSNYILGENRYFITEACEFKNNYHSLFPDALVVLNIEADHMDFFKTFDALEQSFQKMIDQSKKVVINIDNHMSVPEDGIQICIEDNCSEIIDSKLSPENKSEKKNILWACNLKSDCKGMYSFKCNLNSEYLGKIHLGIACRHNVYNALAAIAVSLNYGIDFDIIKKALKTFKGVKRRFEILGNIGAALTIHDYAHHPTELSSIIKSTREFATKKIWAVFEPHTYTRTFNLIDDFVESLLEADEIIILPTYSAREKILKGGRAEDLYKKIKKFTNNCYFCETYTKALEKLEKETKECDTILLLGAGNIENFPLY